MRLAPGMVIAGICVVAIALGAYVWKKGSIVPGTISNGPEPAATKRSFPAVRPGLESFPDPNAPETDSRVFIDSNAFDQFIFGTALAFTGPIRDAGSLEEVREAVRGRGRRGLAALRRDTIRSAPTRPRRFARPSVSRSRSRAFICTRASSPRPNPG